MELPASSLQRHVLAGELPEPAENRVADAGAHFGLEDEDVVVHAVVGLGPQHRAVLRQQEVRPHAESALLALDAAVEEEVGADAWRRRARFRFGTGVPGHDREAPGALPGERGDELLGQGLAEGLHPRPVLEGGEGKDRQHLARRQFGAAGPRVQEAPDQDGEDQRKGQTDRRERRGLRRPRARWQFGGCRLDRGRRVLVSNLADGLQEPVAEPRQGLDVARRVRAVPERPPNAFDAGVHALVELDVNLVGPEVAPNGVARHDAAPVGDQQMKQPGRLGLEPNGLRVAVQFERRGVELELSETQAARGIGGSAAALVGQGLFCWRLGRRAWRCAVTALHGLASRLLGGTVFRCRKPGLRQPPDRAPGLREGRRRLARSILDHA